MKLLKKVLAFISILFLVTFTIPQDIAAQSPTTKDTAIGCPYDYKKIEPGYASRAHEFIGRSIVLKALQQSYAYMYNQLPSSVDSSTQRTIDNLYTCWDSIFITAANMVQELSVIKENDVNSNIVGEIAAKYQLEDSLARTRLLMSELKQSVDNVKTTLIEVDSLTLQEENLAREVESLREEDVRLLALSDSINKQMEDLKEVIFGKYLTKDTAAFHTYRGLLDTVKTLLKIKALPESARLIFLLLNKDSIVNNRETFDRLAQECWTSIKYDVEGVLVQFFPSINDLEVDFSCASILLELIQHTEDSTTSEILPLIGTFWDCYWAGEEEQHLQEFALDPDLNIHDEAGPIDIAQLEEMRLSLTQMYDTLYLSDTQLIVLNLLETISWMNQAGRLSQKAADVAQDLLLKPLSGDQIIQIREKFWNTVHKDFQGMMESFRSYLNGKKIKDNCLEIVVAINRLEDNLIDTKELNDLIYSFWLCQHN